MTHSANDHLEHHNTERPDIDFVRVEILSENFRGSELWSSTTRVRYFGEPVHGYIVHGAEVREDAAFKVARIVFEASCKAEVGDLYTTIRTNQNVGQLEVAMDNTMRVEACETVKLCGRYSR